MIFFESADFEDEEFDEPSDPELISPDNSVEVLQDFSFGVGFDDISFRAETMSVSVEQSGTWIGKLWFPSRLQGRRFQATLDFEFRRQDLRTCGGDL